MYRSNSPGLLIVALFFTLTVALGLFSDSVYHDDDLTHYLFARWSSVFPECLLHIWGRPGLTIPLAAVAWIGDSHTGWHACRILSAMATALSTILAIRLARRLGVQHLAWIALFAYLQPLNAILAYTTLTENFCALYLVAACVYLVEKRLLIASAIFSLVLVTRHEAMVFLPIWCIAILVTCQSWRNLATTIALSLWAPILHNVAFWMVFGEWPLKMYSAPHGSSQYLPAGWLAYIPHALMALTPVVAAISLVGGISLIARGKLLVPALAGVFLLTHIVIRALGIFASGGYGRFLVTISPLIAIMAAAGLDRILPAQTRRPRTTSLTWSLVGIWTLAWMAVVIEGRAGRIPLPLDPWRWTMPAVFAISILAGLLLALPKYRPLAITWLTLTCLAQCAFLIQPLRLRPNQLAARHVVDWLQSEHLDSSPIFTTNPWFPYFMGLIEHPRAHKGPQLLASMPVGTIFIWDSLYSESDFHRLSAESFNHSHDYELLRVFEPLQKGGAEFRLYRKTQPTPIPVEPTKTYPPDLAAGAQPRLGIYYIKEGQNRDDLEPQPDPTPDR